MIDHQVYIQRNQLFFPILHISPVHDYREQIFYMCILYVHSTYTYRTYIILKNICMCNGACIKYMHNMIYIHMLAMQSMDLSSITWMGKAGFFSIDIGRFGQKKHTHARIHSSCKRFPEINPPPRHWCLEPLSEAEMGGFGGDSPTPISYMIIS